MEQFKTGNVRLIAWFRRLRKRAQIEFNFRLALIDKYSSVLDRPS